MGRFALRHTCALHISHIHLWKKRGKLMVNNVLGPSRYSGAVQFPALPLTTEVHGPRYVGRGEQEGTCTSYNHAVRKVQTLQH